MDKYFSVTLPPVFLEKPMYGHMAFSGEKKLNATGSVPSTITDIPNASSGADAWQNWHVELKSRYGLATANSLWMLAWAKWGSVGIFGTSTSSLRTYMASQGITLDENALASLEDTGLGFLNGIGSVLKTGEITALIIIAVILGGVVLLGVGLFKHPEIAGKVARAAAM